MIVTCTGAWSSLPASRGCLSVIEIGIVAPDEPDPELLLPELLATVPIRLTTPGVTWLSGSVTCARSPTLTLDCWEASRLTCTWRRVDVAWATGAPGVAPVPSVAVTEVIRTGAGRNTA